MDIYCMKIKTRRLGNALSLTKTRNSGKSYKIGAIV
jgi:hypothetical protein